MKKAVKGILLACFGIFTSVSCLCAADGTGVIPIAPESVKIWDAGNHNAFTDLIKFKGKFYCAFREGTGHVPTAVTGVGDGTIRILVSGDGTAWESAALLKRDGFDLRDAKISETPDGRLLVTMGGSVYIDGNLVKRIPQYSLSDTDGAAFSDPADAVIDESVINGGDWLWRVTWYKGVGYGVIYQYNTEPDWNAWLVKTTDAVHYEKVAKLEVPGHPNEATVRFAPDGTMRILVRREADTCHAFIGKAAFPFDQWEWTDTGESLGGPNMIFLPDGTLFAGGRVKGKTGLGIIDEAGIFHSAMTLPSSGDNSYPGFWIEGNNLMISYYSSHEGKTSIYLTWIPLEKIEK